MTSVKTNVNRAGRMYTKGSPVGNDLRAVIILELQSVCKTHGDNKDVLPRGAYAKVAKLYRISASCIRKIWFSFQATGKSDYQRPTYNPGRKVTEDDIQFVRFLKKEDPCMYIRTIQDRLLEHSALETVSKATISRIITKDLNMSFKKAVHVNKNRFSDENMRYTQAYIQYIQMQEPNRLKFMDEMGVKLTDGHPRYGHAPKDTEAVTLTRYNPHANCTLSLVMGLNGVCYSKVIPAASNMAEYLQFFTEAVDSFTDDGYPALQRGDIVVVDNAAIHHNEAERLMYNFLGAMDIQYVFLPTYSPDFNPAELVFSKIKKTLKSPEYSALLDADLKVAVLSAVSEITASDCLGFFKHTDTIVA